MNKLILILGDQLSLSNPALTDFDPIHDKLLMIEARDESTHVWSHKARIVYFLAAMRQFAKQLSQNFGCSCLDYRQIQPEGSSSFSTILIEAIEQHRPQHVLCQACGDIRLTMLIEQACSLAQCALVWTVDAHFMCSTTDFARWANGKKQLRMEYFYRWMRQRTGILMQGDEPVGGQWNYDSDNRQSIPKQGLGWIAPIPSFELDSITLEVIELVNSQFSRHPGALTAIHHWPLNREDALIALTDFVTHRLQDFGQFQDAMWTNEPYLFHSLLSAPLNCQLLHPQEVIDAALIVYQQGKAPLNSVEGFIRQILGWREFMRGMYHLHGKTMMTANYFNHQRPLPDWYWTGNTVMNCLKQVIHQTLETGYAHHIQRLMIMGLYSTLAELHPQQVSDWFQAVYVDAVDWVQRPNVIGMALYAHGGLLSSKPYLASGAYIDKMSNYCKGCRFQPKEKTGNNACPITQLYWRFLIQHQNELAANPRTSLMVSHVKNMNETDKAKLLLEAERLLAPNYEP